MVDKSDSVIDTFQFPTLSATASYGRRAGWLPGWPANEMYVGKHVNFNP